MTPEEAARLFAESLPTVDRIIRELALRAGLSRERRHEFGAWAIARLVDDSYELVRRFGVVEFSTYLSVTLSTWLGEFIGQSSSPVVHAAPLGELFVQVLCVGTVVGAARFDSIEGLAYAPFSPAQGYDMIADAVRAAGGSLSARHFWPSDAGDFASGLAAQWSAPPLSLIDAFGREIAASSVVVVGGVHVPGRAGGAWVIADFRADGARVPASLRAPDGTGHDANDANDANDSKNANDSRDANARPAA